MKKKFALLLMLPVALVLLVAAGSYEPTTFQFNVIAGWYAKFIGNGNGLTNLNTLNMNFTNSTWYNKTTHDPVIQIDDNGGMFCYDPSFNLIFSFDPTVPGVTMFDTSGNSLIETTTDRVRLYKTEIASSHAIYGNGTGLTNIMPNIGSNSVAVSGNISIYLTNQDGTVYRVAAQRVVP